MAVAWKGQRQTASNSLQSGIWGKIIALWLNWILGHLHHSNEMVIVVTLPLHLPDYFLPDYRAGSRGDYLPTATHLLYVCVGLFCQCKPPLSQLLLHITRLHSPEGRQGYRGVLAEKTNTFNPSYNHILMSVSFKHWAQHKLEHKPRSAHKDEDQRSQNVLSCF